MIRTLEKAESIVIPSAGCSAHLSRLHELLAEDAEWCARARAVADRCEDFVVWMHRNRDRIEWRSDLRRVVFQRPCHLRHAQGINGAAEEVLCGINGVELLETTRPDLCCGSAGAWSLEFPELARERRGEKMADLLGPGPELILTANPGCELFLDGGPEGVPVRHLAEYLAELLPGS
jgi:glycolate oxidase iron-sulfur subunit